MFLCFCAITPSWAQEDEEQELDTSIATLSVQYGRNGFAYVFFSSGPEITNWTPLESALANALHCPAGSLKHSPVRPLPEKYLQRLPPDRRQIVERQVTHTWEHSLEGACSSTLTRKQFAMSTELSFKDVLRELQKVGGQQLSVTIDFPTAKFHEFTP